MTEHSFIGKSTPRVDSLPKAVGEARFVDDMILPHMLYGKVLRSPYPHARILSIDTSAALKLPGVRAVVTADDTLKEKFGLLPRFRDQHLLAVDKVHYLGEEVAGVAATDEATAQEALGLIKVEYQELPFVLDPVEAMKDGAPQIHDHVERNISLRSFLEYGDIEKAFREADFVREIKVGNEVMCHCQIEPYVALASWEEGKLHVWMPNQSPFTRRRALSNLLGLPVEKIRVHHCYIGGAFGGRSDTFPAEFIAGLLSMKSGLPVKISLSRQETFAVMRMHHGAIYDIKIGVRKDGTILAAEINGVLDGGAFLSSGTNAINSGANVLEGLYRFQNFKYEGFRAYTNKTTASMYHVQMVPLGVGIEALLDLLAGDVGIDPVEIRLKNAVEPNETLPHKSVISSCKLKECIERSVELTNYKERRGKLGPGRGIGLGCAQSSTGFPLGIRFGSSAFVKLNETGSATVISGIVDNGQGNENLMVQIAADELGLSLDEVALVNGDTELCPQDPGSYSMTATYVSANAVRLAAQDARQQILNIASSMMETTSDRLELKDHRVCIDGDLEKAVPVDSVIRLSLLRGTPVLGRGTFIPQPASPLGWADQYAGKMDGQYGPTYTFGSAVAEVDVDLETGQVQLLKLTLVNDVGFAINPMLVEGQIDSVTGLIVGHLLYEKHEWGEGGQLLTDGLQSYAIPTTVDMPTMDRNLMDSGDPAGPYGAKDSGPTGGVAGAIVNAIYDAAGVYVTQMPITPETVLAAIKEKKNAGNGPR